jgi:arginine repressor
MSDETLVRVDRALVSKDLMAYKAAKLRKQREKYFKSLESRINKLEDEVQRLERTIKEIKK